MPHSEWDNNHDLITPHGTLELCRPTALAGTSTGFALYLIDHDGSGIATGPRVEKDEVPQSDGWIFHRRFETGTLATIVLKLMLTNELPACDSDLRCMIDNLDLHLRSLLNADGPYRLRWQPSGYFQDDDVTPALRMLDQIRLADWQPTTFEEGICTYNFSLDSPFPYAIDFTQQGPPATTVADTTTKTFTMIGNTDFYPVIKVNGPASIVIISNDTTGLSILYDGSTLPGGQDIGPGDYGEIDTFKQTMFLNGDQDDLRPGINYLGSDFFPLVPGPNAITVFGADVDFLINNAWW